MRWPYRLWLLIALLATFALSAVRPISTSDFLFEHIPTAIALAWIIWFGVRSPLSDLSYTLLFLFFLLHVLGAHYTYSKVPYDAWGRAWFGFSINEALGTDRNHYDRLMHFLFGVFITPVASELASTFGKIRPGFWAAVFGVSFVSLGGNMYEVLEWLLTLTASPEMAETYNGQQGDLFDAQKDLTLNLAGALISGLLVTLRRWPGGACSIKTPGRRV